MSDFALFLVAAGAALIAAIAAVGAAVLAFRWRKAAAGASAPIHNGNGKHRPWFRFWLTFTTIMGFFVIVETLLAGDLKLTVPIAALIGSLLNGLTVVLVLSFKWWFEHTDELPDTTETPNGNAQPDKAPEPASTSQKARPDDY